MRVRSFATPIGLLTVHAFAPSAFAQAKEPNAQEKDEEKAEGRREERSL